MTAPFRYLVCLPLLLLGGPSCPAQVVTIRVINAADGRPLQNLKITVSLLYDPGERAPAKHDAYSTLKTDANGETQLNLPQPPPAHLSVQVQIDQGRWYCGCDVLAATKDVIQKGFVSSAASAKEVSKSPALVKAVPAEIRIVARPVSFLQRLFYPITKG